MSEYKDRLEERITKFPEAAAVLETPIASLRLKEKYPWAKSAIVCIEYYGKYKFPVSLQGMYAKSFLLSSAVPEYPNRKGKRDFEKWMTSKGIHYEGGEPICRGKFFRSDRQRLPQVWEFSEKIISSTDRKVHGMDLKAI